MAEVGGGSGGGANIDLDECNNFWVDDLEIDEDLFESGGGGAVRTEWFGGGKRGFSDEEATILLSGGGAGEGGGGEVGVGATPLKVR